MQVFLFTLHLLAMIAVHLRGDGNPEIPHGFSMGHAAMYRRVYIYIYMNSRPGKHTKKFRTGKSPFFIGKSSQKYL